MENTLNVSLTNRGSLNSHSILILGAQGQLGQALAEHLRKEHPHLSLILATRREADFSRPQACLEYVRQCRPSMILNAAAYTQVDLAEKERDLALTINAETPGVLAQECAAKNIPWVHFSTDYVFSGQGTQPWKETDEVAPLNFYGQSKAEGERRIAIAGGPFLLFRTSWVYDAQGKNFLTTMIRLGKEREEIRVVCDQHGAPTYAVDLARATWDILQQCLQMPQFPSGIYHLCGEGETQWHEFAQTIFENLKSAPHSTALRLQRLVPITSSEYPTPARRPSNSRLDTQKVQDIFKLKLPHWRNSLQACMQRI